MESNNEVLEDTSANRVHNTTNPTNISSEYYCETEVDFVEIHSAEVKAVFVTIACVSVISNVSALTCMQRAKKIPYAAKFLSTGLLIFDLLFVVTSTLRKFIEHPSINLNIHAVVTLWLQLVTVTVVLMAIERYVLILKPMWYMRNVTELTIRITAMSVWLIETILWIFIRYGVCYFKFKSTYVITKPGLCDNIMSMSYGILLIVGFVISYRCYWKIFKLIQTKVVGSHIKSASETARELRSYKSTSIIAVYIVVITCTTVAFLIIIILIQLGLLGQNRRRICVEIVSLCNCIVDPFLYVIWFKESRLEMLKFVAVVFTRYRQTVEDMRMDVYNIVISDCKAKVNRDINYTTLT